MMPYKHLPYSSWYKYSVTFQIRVKKNSNGSERYAKTPLQLVYFLKVSLLMIIMGYTLIRIVEIDYQRRRIATIIKIIRIIYTSTIIFISFFKREHLAAFFNCMLEIDKKLKMWGCHPSFK